LEYIIVIVVSTWCHSGFFLSTKIHKTESIWSWSDWNP